MEFDSHTSALASKYKCDGCGAMLTYQPGTTYLKCTYCGAQNEIEEQPDLAKEVVSLPFNDFADAINDVADLRYTVQAEVVKCENCGASTTLGSHITADVCGFCATPLVIDHQIKRIVKPHGLIPFVLEEKKVYPLFAKWANNLWFTPNDFKQIFQANNQRLKGLYIPFWSFDAKADTNYEGERGEYYYVNVTVKGQDGKNQTVRQQKTRWYYASGNIHNVFKNIIVTASTSLPNQFASKIGPWDMNSLKHFDENYLSGFVTETFSIDHHNGKIAATQIMDEDIAYAVRRDIGGDTQRVNRIGTDYYDIKVKYILLPIWLSAYKYKNKTYQIMVNAFNGRVYGQRPYSIWKIAGLVLLLVAILAILMYASK